jgi:hypothetical protein
MFFYDKLANSSYHLADLTLTMTAITISWGFRIVELKPSDKAQQARRSYLFYY